MADNEYYGVVVTTPPAALPHKSRQAEIVELAEYLRVLRTSPDGTNPIVQDSTKLGDNTEKIYVETSTTTPNLITAIKSYVSGVWTRWTIGGKDIDPDALGNGLILDGNNLDVNHDETFALRDAAEEGGKQELYAKPLVNETQIAYVDNTSGKAELAIPTAAPIDSPVLTTPAMTSPTMSAPVITGQTVINPDGFAPFTISSNASDDIGTGAHCWLASWGGAPIDFFVTSGGVAGVFRFTHEEFSGPKMSPRAMNVADMQTDTTGLVNGDVYWDKVNGKLAVVEI